MKLIHNSGSSADEYHTESSNRKTAKQIKTGYEMNYDRQAAASLAVTQKAPAGEFISLKIDGISASMSIEEAILQRRSGREFGDQALSLQELSKVLYLANGARPAEEGDHEKGDSMHFNAPSAGGLSSTQMHVFVLNTHEVEPGIYLFDKFNNALTLKKKGNFSTWLKSFGILQVEFAQAGAVIVLSSQMARLAEKYALRAYRLALMDVGHVSENIYLAAQALGLSVCATAGFVDSEINSALDLDGLDECALLVLGIGTKS